MNATQYFYNKDGAGTQVYTAKQAEYYGYKNLPPATEEQIAFHLMFMEELFCNEEGGLDGLGLSHVFTGGRIADDGCSA